MAQPVPSPGTRLYCVQWDIRHGWTLTTAWFVHHKGGWRRLRNIYTGSECNEHNLKHWKSDPHAAVMDFFAMWFNPKIRKDFDNDIVPNVCDASKVIEQFHAIERSQRTRKYRR